MPNSLLALASAAYFVCEYSRVFISEPCVVFGNCYFICFFPFMPRPSVPVHVYQF